MGTGGRERCDKKGSGGHKLSASTIPGVTFSHLILTTTLGCSYVVPVSQVRKLRPYQVT